MKLDEVVEREIEGLNKNISDLRHRDYIQGCNDTITDITQKAKEFMKEEK